MREKINARNFETKKIFSEKTESDIQKALDKNIICLNNKKTQITSDTIRINLDEIDNTVDFMERYLSKEVTSNDLKSIIKTLFSAKEVIEGIPMSNLNSKEPRYWDSFPFVTDFKRHINNVISNIKSGNFSSEEKKNFLFKIDGIISKLSQISSK